MQISLSKIAELLEGEVKGDPNKMIRGAAPFEAATPEQVTFAGDAKFLKRMHETSAGAVIVPRDFQYPSKNIIRVDHPQVAFVKALNLFHAPRKQKPGIDSAASIGKNFVCGADVSIGPFAAIQDHVTLGNRVTLHPHVFLGDNVVIGDDVEIFPNVTVYQGCRIGSRVIIHAGTVIGSDGFGFAHDGKTYHKIPHTGIVQIDDDVEIGAGNTIDRATFGKTWIRQGVKTDNQVHIAHNVIVGENSVLVAQVGISGSVTIGKHAVLAGQAGVAGHLEIGDNVTIGPRAGIAKSVPSGEVVSGAPEMPHRTWLKVNRILPRLPELKKKLEALEKRLEKMEKAGS